MSEHGNNKTESVPHHIQLIQMGRGYWVSQIVFVAAKLGLADQLEEGPKSARELAPSIGVHVNSLHRLMRTLASLGILSEDKDNRFTLTPLGEALKTDAPGSARYGIMALVNQWRWRAWEELTYAIETGRTGMEKAWGMPIFEFVAKYPEEASYYSEFMVAFHGSEPLAVAVAYDFSTLETIVDIGGATGNLLTTILTRHSKPRGVLFDLPHVVQDAPTKMIEKQGLTDRITIEAGNFFERVPMGGDVYLLSHIIHDWTEDQCLTILMNCRRAMKPGSKLLIIEMVLPVGDTPHQGKLLDIAMLVMTGGKERTEAEYSALLEKAGFNLTRTVPTESAVSIVEAAPI